MGNGSNSRKPPPGRGAARYLGGNEALQRLELLARINTVLSRAMEDYSQVLVEVAETCVPAFCDLCAVELIGDLGESEVPAYRVDASSSLTVGDRWQPVGQGISFGHGPILSHDRVDEPAAARAVREAIGAQSLIVAPIASSGLTRGWLVLAASHERRGFRPSALRVAEDVATRVATCIQRVLLYCESIEAERQQTRAARRLRRLASAAANLAGADTPAEVLRLACLETCIILDGDAAAARWEADGASDIEVCIGVSDSGAVDTALAAATYRTSAHGEGWVAASLPFTEAGHRGSVAVFSHKEMSADDELLLTSLASMVPVAFERAMHTQEALLREAELDAVLEASPVALLTMARDGTVLTANQAALDLFGWAPDRATMEFPDTVRAAMLRLPPDVEAAGSVSNLPVTDDRLELSVSAAPMPASDTRQPAILVVASDVREQRSAERALLQAQRLEAMGQVAGGIAHDFNNLLTVMIGYSAILKRRLHEPDDLRVLDSIETAASRAAALTQQLLGFTRRQLDDVVVLDLVELVRDLHAVLDRVAGPAITVDLRLPSRPVTVQADASSVEQTVLNLAINARDAMERGGKLTISVDEIALDSNGCRSLGVEQGGYARLVVSDDGPGMLPEVLARCLDPFYTTKEKGKGTGLGLPTAYGQAVERGGTLTIASSPGEGTVVTVLLPSGTGVGPVAVAHAAAARQAETPALRGRALLVEDQDDLRRLAHTALSEAGMEVTDATDAETALALLGESGGWDVLVTDIVLPGMSGVELASHLRNLHPRLAVLYISGYADRETRRRGLVDRARLLRKPFRPVELCQRVAELLAAEKNG